MCSILAALRRLRELGFAHRSIEPSRIFLSDTYEQVRLGWGEDVCYSEESALEKAVGSSVY